MSLSGAKLIPLKKGQLGVALEIATDEVSAGSDLRCTIRIHKKDVERKHCVIQRKGIRVVLSTLAECNNVLINDKPVLKVAELKHNDIITISNRKFLWDFDESLSKDKYRRITTFSKQNLELDKKSFNRASLPLSAAKQNFEDNVAKQIAIVKPLQNKQKDISYETISEPGPSTSKLKNVKDNKAFRKIKNNTIHVMSEISEGNKGALDKSKKALKKRYSLSSTSKKSASNFLKNFKQQNPLYQISSRKSLRKSVLSKQPENVLKSFNFNSKYFSKRKSLGSLATKLEKDQFRLTASFNSFSSTAELLLHENCVDVDQINDERRKSISLTNLTDETALDFTDDMLINKFCTTNLRETSSKYAELDFDSNESPSKADNSIKENMHILQNCSEIVDFDEQIINSVNDVTLKEKNEPGHKLQLRKSSRNNQSINDFRYSDDILKDVTPNYKSTEKSNKRKTLNNLLTKTLKKKKKRLNISYPISLRRNSVPTFNNKSKNNQGQCKFTRRGKKDLNNAGVKDVEDEMKFASFTQIDENNHSKLSRKNSTADQEQISSVQTFRGSLLSIELFETEDMNEKEANVENSELDACLIVPKHDTKFKKSVKDQLEIDDNLQNITYTENIKSQEVSLKKCESFTSGNKNASVKNKHLTSEVDFVKTKNEVQRNSLGNLCKTPLKKCNKLMNITYPSLRKSLRISKNIQESVNDSQPDFQHSINLEDTRKDENVSHDESFLLDCNNLLSSTQMEDISENEKSSKCIENKLRSNYIHIKNNKQLSFTSIYNLSNNKINKRKSMKKMFNEDLNNRGNSYHVYPSSLRRSSRNSTPSQKTDLNNTHKEQCIDKSMKSIKFEETYDKDSVEQEKLSRQSLKNKSHSVNTDKISRSKQLIQKSTTEERSYLLQSFTLDSQKGECETFTSIDLEDKIKNSRKLVFKYIQENKNQQLVVNSAATKLNSTKNKVVKRRSVEIPSNKSSNYELRVLNASYHSYPLSTSKSSDNSEICSNDNQLDKQYDEHSAFENKITQSDMQENVNTKQKLLRKSLKNKSDINIEMKNSEELFKSISENSIPLEQSSLFNLENTHETNKISAKRNDVPISNVRINKNRSFTNRLKFNLAFNTCDMIKRRKSVGASTQNKIINENKGLNASYHIYPCSNKEPVLMDESKIIEEEGSEKNLKEITNRECCFYREADDLENNKTKSDLSNDILNIDSSCMLGSENDHYINNTDEQSCSTACDTFSNNNINKRKSEGALFRDMRKNRAFLNTTYHSYPEFSRKSLKESGIVQESKFVDSQKENEYEENLEEIVNREHSSSELISDLNMDKTKKNINDNSVDSFCVLNSGNNYCISIPRSTDIIDTIEQLPTLTTTVNRFSNNKIDKRKSMSSLFGDLRKNKAQLNASYHSYPIWESKFSDSQDENQCKDNSEEIADREYSSHEQISELKENKAKESMSNASTKIDSSYILDKPLFQSINHSEMNNDELLAPKAAFFKFSNNKIEKRKSLGALFKDVKKSKARLNASYSFMRKSSRKSLQIQKTIINDIKNSNQDSLYAKTNVSAENLSNEQNYKSDNETANATQINLSNRRISLRNKLISPRNTIFSNNKIEKRKSMSALSRRVLNKEENLNASCHFYPYSSKDSACELEKSLSDSQVTSNIGENEERISGKEFLFNFDSDKTGKRKTINTVLNKSKKKKSQVNATYHSYPQDYGSNLSKSISNESKCSESEKVVEDIQSYNNKNQNSYYSNSTLEDSIRSRSIANITTEDNQSSKSFIENCNVSAINKEITPEGRSSDILTEKVYESTPVSVVKLSKKKTLLKQIEEKPLDLQVSNQVVYEENLIDEESTTPKSSLKIIPEVAKKLHSTAKKSISRRSLNSDKQIHPISMIRSGNMPEMENNEDPLNDSLKLKTKTKGSRVSFSNISGIKQMFSPTKSPKNDLTNVIGVKYLFQQQQQPSNDLTNVSGVKYMFSPRTSWQNKSLLKIEKSQVDINFTSFGQCTSTPLTMNLNTTQNNRNREYLTQEKNTATKKNPVSRGRRLYSAADINLSQQNLSQSTICNDDLISGCDHPAITSVSSSVQPKRIKDPIFKKFALKKVYTPKLKNIHELTKKCSVVITPSSDARNIIYKTDKSDSVKNNNNCLSSVSESVISTQDSEPNSNFEDQNKPVRRLRKRARKEQGNIINEESFNSNKKIRRNNKNDQKPIKINLNEENDEIKQSLDQENIQIAKTNIKNTKKNEAIEAISKNVEDDLHIKRTASKRRQKDKKKLVEEKKDKNLLQIDKEQNDKNVVLETKVSDEPTISKEDKNVVRKSKRKINITDSNKNRNCEIDHQNSVLKITKQKIEQIKVSEDKQFNQEPEPNKSPKRTLRKIKKTLNTEVDACNSIKTNVKNSRSTKDEASKNITANRNDLEINKIDQKETNENTVTISQGKEPSIKEKEITEIKTRRQKKMFIEQACKDTTKDLQYNQKEQENQIKESEKNYLSKDSCQKSITEFPKKRSKRIIIKEEESIAEKNNFTKDVKESSSIKLLKRNRRAINKDNNVTEDLLNPEMPVKILRTRNKNVKNDEDSVARKETAKEIVKGKTNKIHLNENNEKDEVTCLKPIKDTKLKKDIKTNKSKTRIENKNTENISAEEKNNAVKHQRKAISSRLQSQENYEEETCIKQNQLQADPPGKSKKTDKNKTEVISEATSRVTRSRVKK